MTITYSQPATKQDLWVVNRLRLDDKEWYANAHGKPAPRGYFVEIGAHDGLRHSNTRLLEERYGWRGLLVEANEGLYQQCRINRSLAWSQRDVVGRADGDWVYFIYGEDGSRAFGGIKHHMPREWVEEHRMRASPGEPRQTTSLATLLKEMSMPPVIDYLSLDVEGAELAILDGYFNGPAVCRHIFNIITVEFRYDKFLLDQLTDLLSLYTLEHVEAFDAFFVRKDFVGFNSALRLAA